MKRMAAILAIALSLSIRVAAAGFDSPFTDPPVLSGSNGPLESNVIRLFAGTNPDCFPGALLHRNPALHFCRVNEATTSANLAHSIQAPRTPLTGSVHPVHRIQELLPNDQTLPKLKEPEAPDVFRNGLLGSLIGSSPDRPTGFVDLNLYGDTRDFSVFTINTGARLPHQFEYFQFINLTGDFGNSPMIENWTGFFTEIHLRRPIASDNDLLKHLDWSVMWADGSVGREVGRLGIRWRFQDIAGPVGDFFTDTLRLKYSLTFHILEDDGSGWQLEHVYRRDFLDGLVYVSGFADHNINGTADSSSWVTETQIGVRLFDRFYAVAEYRYTSFAPSQFRSGWGIGVEYAIPFL
ncbi:MAG: hypothetical protein KDA96_10770 [Planctomycetaceae bacterium]|nr:hypothetical protein [Planctomycetaceae bacterium]